MSTTSIFTVKGMTCDHCVAAVTEEIQQIPAVSAVRVDLASGALTVTSETPIDAADVKAAVEEAGDYELIS